MAATENTDRHPPGLVILFFTEMWERFSFYGMKAMLLLYLMDQFHYKHEGANDIYTWYIALVYCTPLFGGYLADRVLGYKKTILLGGALMMVGHFLMAVEKFPVFVAALVLLILGNGAFKANISAVVGLLYKEGDPRRDRGFSIFYLGINIGATASPILCGWLHEHYGFAYGFGAAGVGMLIGLVTFWLGQPYLRGIDLDAPRQKSVEQPKAQAENAGGELDPKVVRGRLIALGLISFFVIFFWMAYEQSGNTLTVWAKDNTDRNFHLPIIGTFHLTVEAFQSINPIFILTLTPLLNMLWKFLSHRKQEPSSPLKQALGLVFMGVSFVVMMAAARAAGSESGIVSSWWLVISYFFGTVGELLLSPIGLSLFSKLAPPRLAGLVMGIWFISIFVGNKLSGVTGAYWDRMSHYRFFGIFVVSSLVAAGLMFALLKPLKRLMAGAD